MSDVLVTCINKSNTNSSHEHITHLGNPAAQWRWSREQVIASIDAGTNTFYVVDARNGARATIGVVRQPGLPGYFRSYADGQWNNNLLSLAQCPI